MCFGEAANHQLPMAVAIFIELHLLTNENTEVVLLINCLAWRGVLVMDNTFPIKKHSYHGLDLAVTLLHPLRAWRTR